MPISICLDDDVRDELQHQAQIRGIGLGTLLRELATRAAQEARRGRIRDASGAVASHVASSAKARAFYKSWGTLDTDTD